MQKNLGNTVVLLGTGGTIAGTAASATDAVGYTAAQIGVAELLASVGGVSGARPGANGPQVELEQVAQVDSKNMSHALWLTLAQRVAHHLARREVRGVVVTHGTDTMEETAYFLQRLLAPSKPVVLTGAMRPATSIQADGPQNLADAFTVACSEGAQGVVVVFAGQVISAIDVRKVHSHRLHAFDAGDAGPVGREVMRSLQKLRDWPATPALGLGHLPTDATQWPRVEVVFSHAGADGRVVHALMTAGVDGLVVGGTGNGTLNEPLERALAEARAQGMPVLLGTRCVDSPPMGNASWEASPCCSVWQSRVELMLRLMG